MELPYLNRARLAFTSAAFVAGGAVPGVKEANKKEPLLPWGRYHQVRRVPGSFEGLETPGHGAAELVWLY